MASKINMIAILAIFTAAISTLSQATEYVVGDDYGWTLGFNYTAWAHGKEFQVGDTLVFKYAMGKHNVFIVSGSQFLECNAPPANEAMTTGNDRITLATPGKKWYICGVGQHCQSGMKLVINVVDTTSEAPSSAPWWSPTWRTPAPAPLVSVGGPTQPAPAPLVSVGGPTQHIVGDERGWTLNFNYTAWAQGRTFRVGDSLVFRYPVGYHNVYKVGGPDFQACKVPPANEALTTGNDMITLTTAGLKWYICGIGNGIHCEAGQKLVITVYPAEWEAPSPPPSSAYTSLSHSPSPAMAWEGPASSPISSIPSNSYPPSPSDGATPSESVLFYNRFLKY